MHFDFDFGGATRAKPRRRLLLTTAASAWTSRIRFCRQNFGPYTVDLAPRAIAGAGGAFPTFPLWAVIIPLPPRIPCRSDVFTINYTQNFIEKSQN